MPRYTYTMPQGSNVPTDGPFELPADGLTLGYQFTLAAPMRIVGFRWFHLAGEKGPAIGQVWDATPELVVCAIESAKLANLGLAADGWRNFYSAQQPILTTGVTYQLCVTPVGGHTRTTFNGLVGTGIDVGPVHILGTLETNGGGSFNEPNSFGQPPLPGGSPHLYGVDMILSPLV